MNTTTKVIAVLIVLGAIGGGAYLLRKGTTNDLAMTQTETATTTNDSMTQTPPMSTASSTLPIATGDIDADMKALSGEAQAEGNVSASSDEDGAAATSDRADITSINDSYGENNF